MLKTLDRYLIKTFFGPFFFIFSVLFFIFLVNIIWIQLGTYIEKGLSYTEIVRLLFYLGAGIVNLVLPLTILLSAIMTFGDLGERYELAAMKAAGISLTRIMAPLFFVSILLSVVLFFFSNDIIPDFQKRARNMMRNIAESKPALNFTQGQFIDQVPGYLIKFDELKDAQRINGVFIHKIANTTENQQSVLAKSGELVPAKNRNFLKLQLYKGYVFDSDFGSVDYSKRSRQPDRAIKFDTLTMHFDISKVIKKMLDAENGGDSDYQSQSFRQLDKTIVNTKKESGNLFKTNASELISETSPYLISVEKKQKPKPAKYAEPNFAKMKQDKKNMILNSAYSKLQQIKSSSESRHENFLPSIKYYSKVVIFQQRIISYAFTCIIFFLIGASLGSITRKGGLGIPVIIAIVVYIIFYLMNLTVENFSWEGKLNPYLAAWLPNLVMFPFSIWLTYKALTDSQVFDAEKYKAWFKPIISKFSRKKEHARYR